MDFDGWMAGHDFFKADTAEAFEPIWDMLIEHNDFTSEQAADFLDGLVGAMRREYGE